MCKFQALYIEDFDNLRNKLEELNLTKYHFLNKILKYDCSILLICLSYASCFSNECLKKEK